MNFFSQSYRNNQQDATV